jgi:hypothetical protein
LRVVLRSEGRGDAMWRSETSEGDVALLGVRPQDFGDGTTMMTKAAYRRLPAVHGWAMQNRFVGGHLLYSASDYGEAGNKPFVYAVPLAGGEAARIDLPHGVTRLDALGTDAVAIGSDSKGSLGFSAIALDHATGAAKLENTYMLPAAQEGEVRSQAFFFRPDPGSPDGARGVLGLPVTHDLKRPGSEFLGSGSAIVFLRRDERRLSPLGELAADDADATPDNCVASCVDWYGNARPIFLGDRAFALLGYELVEGRIGRSGIGEVRRIDFAPPVKATTRH